MKESNYKKLVYNTAIFAIGNFGSKVLTFLIVPLYTYVLTTAEYGVIDLFITSLGMVIPFSTVVFRSPRRGVQSFERQSREKSPTVQI